MPIDFSKLGSENNADNAIQPREIFSLLPEKDSKYQYPRDVQTEVWNKWFDRRDEDDLVLKMNTGSGKTVVGLLILKSCLNENKGPAVYVTPDQYLVEQVIQEANNLGLSVTDNPRDTSYISGNSILVINIYKLINGLSVFGVGDEGVKIPIGSIIIDDTHACLTNSENQFTLRIDSDLNAFKKLLTLFENDLKRQSESKYLELEAGDKTATLQVPHWAWIDKSTNVLRTLHEYKDLDEIKFIWPLIKENIKLSKCIFNGKRLEISPKFLPIDIINSFTSASRRIYMSATIADDSVLITHFNVKEDNIKSILSPNSSSDIGDRMILTPQAIIPEISDKEIRDLVRSYADKYNVTVIVPSFYRAEFWEDVSDQVLDRGNIIDGVKNLKNKHVGLSLLVNRYDGIDLPKDATHLLVIDGLPDLRTLSDKLKQVALRNSSEIISEFIQIIEQGMGRAVRSNDDYCGILLMGRTLVNYLYSLGAKNYFTEITKTQIELSENLAKQLEGEKIDEIRQALDHCLERNKQWVEASKGAISKISYDSNADINYKFKLERVAFNKAMQEDFIGASNIVQEIIDGLENKEEKGWYLQELSSYTYFTDPVAAHKIQRSAYENNNYVLKPLEGITYEKLSASEVEQAKRCKEYCNENFQSCNEIILGIRSVTESLVFKDNSASAFEESLKAIALFLGFNSQRQEQQLGKGQDVLWEVGDNNYFVIECKNEAVTDFISKRYCDQLSGSMNWFNEAYDYTSSAIPIMVHPSTSLHQVATAHKKMRVIDIEKLDELKNSVLELFNLISKKGFPVSESYVKDYLNHFGLNSNKFIERFTSTPK